MPIAVTSASVAGASHTLAVARWEELQLCALTPREQREFANLPHVARQRDWLAGRCAAKRALAARWDVPPDRIELASIPGAAPRPSLRNPAGSWSRLPDRLTIAHRDGIALAAAFPSTILVGVDIERAGDMSPLELRYILSESERPSCDGVDPTLVWALKEAVWKALRLSPCTSLSSPQLVLEAHSRKLIAVRLGEHELPASAAVGRIDASRPLIAAVVRIAREVS
jgi:4'-phosphopantetheinyl transferase EntD